MAAPVLLAALLSVLGAGCALPLRGKDEKPRTATFFAMDTVMDVTVCGGRETLTAEAEALIRRLEAELSVTDPESDIYAVNEAGEGAVGRDAEALIRGTLALCARTEGTLDCTIYPVLRAWGFTAGAYRVPPEEEIASLLTLMDWRAVSLTDGRVTLGDGQMLDLGATAKGYAGDCLIGLFREAGCASAIVNLGGNVQTLGTKPDGSLWRVAVARHDTVAE